MTHYLRKNGNTIVDVEATKDDLSSVVCIEQYSFFLLDQKQIDYHEEVIRDFDDLQELRLEYHENNYLKETPDQLVKRRLQEIAAKYNLSYITD